MFYLFEKVNKLCVHVYECAAYCSTFVYETLIQENQKYIRVLEWNSHVFLSICSLSR